VQVRPKYMIDCPAVDCSGLSSEEISECLMDLCHDDEIRDKMIRINLTNVNRSAYRSIDQGRLNRLGAAALYFKIKLQFNDEAERSERPVDRHKLHEEFSNFLRDEASQKRIPVAILDEVVAYGSKLMKRAVQSRNIEAFDASQ